MGLAAWLRARLRELMRVGMGVQKQGVLVGNMKAVDGHGRGGGGHAGKRALGYFLQALWAGGGALWAWPWC